MMGNQLLMYTGPYQDVVVYMSVSNTWFDVGAALSNGLGFLTLLFW